MTGQLALDLAPGPTLESLCTDAGWPALARARRHGNEAVIAEALAHAVLCGELTPRNARRLLAALAVPEPEDRSVPFLRGPRGLRPDRVVRRPRLRPGDLVEAWGVVHAWEDGWVRRDRKLGVQVTARYWSRVSAPRPPSEAPPPLASQAKPPVWEVNRPGAGRTSVVADDAHAAAVRVLSKTSGREVLLVECEPGEAGWVAEARRVVRPRPKGLPGRREAYADDVVQAWRVV